MGKITEFLEEKVMPIAGKIAGQRHLQVLRDAMVLTIPFIIIGSVFLILANLPIPAYINFLKAHPDIKATLLYPYNGTFNLVALIATFAVGYRLAESYKVDPLASGAVALCSYFVVTPNTTFTVDKVVTTAMNVNYFSSQGLFVGLLIAIFSTEIYRRVVQKNIVIKMPDGVPPTVAKSFTAIIPGFIVIVSVWVIRLLVENFTHFENVHTIVAKLLQQPLTNVGTSLVGTIFVFLLINLLWAIGLHGSTIVGSVMLPIWLQLTSENAAAYAAGLPVDNIVTAEFRYLIFIGGSGATLGLVLAMFFFSKSKQLKQMGRLAIGPGLFNINEPLIFGMPIVLNPIILIPFLITPVISVLITYLSMYYGWVASPIGVLPPGTMPILIGGYLMTGSVSGIVLQLILFAVSFVIYFPFFKIMDNQKYKEEQKALAS
ncbi:MULTISPECIES: PTS cellobiose transporter subunit IIC [Paenibacillus]|jgi:PTS system cellobiose-specific IIC component|uniref:Permease IIC component n=2 Tax=Paenibacillus TaxID=44249 RepID=A0AAJ3IYB1_PAEPO|nr:MULTISPECIES: PTS cellobiose transporter subunit IIC [Paenibacillus]AIW39940.1 oligo-beta-mannoside permease IIC protein [Paenibacillus polymyxa CR1]ALA42244.1 oligo-beta-mannoside permease IIC protein [Paenibacillus peoriae]MBP1176280.1 PTS system cellobiose-specific IIC component [Paenibacillus sp. PvR133]MDH2334492.1 PTS cellobiose transporter subunit IIC [Paenibacillus polymyxa]MDR6775758.1 PTS system cellobiose-specific IIC component [Paenibacillus peoriae]